VVKYGMVDQPIEQDSREFSVDKDLPHAANARLDVMMVERRS
jgi:hypothetical protein